MYSIHIDNIIKVHKRMERCIALIKNFSIGTEYFFGFYRYDGITFTKDEAAEAERLIPDYFRQKGTYVSLTDTVVRRNKKIEMIEGMLHAAKLPVNEETLSFMPYAFRYFGSTVCFCPNVSWETFLAAFQNFHREGSRDYLIKGYTDILFSFVDSGDLIVDFNPAVWNKNKVEYEISQILDRPF